MPASLLEDEVVFFQTEPSDSSNRCYQCRGSAMPVLDTSVCGVIQGHDVHLSVRRRGFPAPIHL